MRKVNPHLLKPHPLAHLIPDMRPSEWRDFYTDIAMRGIKVPLEILADGIVLDGRHRLRAALELAMKEVPVVDAPLSGDNPEAYMLKAAVLRRHLTDSQRAIIAAMFKEKNKKPRGQASPNYGKSSERPDEITGTVFDKTHPAQTEASEFFNVSRWKIDQATYVQKHNPELAAKVHKGDIALSNAYRQAKAPEERRKIEGTKPPRAPVKLSAERRAKLASLHRQKSIFRPKNKDTAVKSDTLT